LLESHLEIPWIDLDQRIARLYRLIIVNEDLLDLAGDLWRYRDDLPIEKRIIGAFMCEAAEEIPEPEEKQERQYRTAEKDYDRPAPK
jgi:hypothetical protein